MNKVAIATNKKSSMLGAFFVLFEKGIIL